MCLPSFCYISFSIPHKALLCCGGNFSCISRLLTLQCDVQSFANTPWVYEMLFQGDAVTHFALKQVMAQGTRSRAASPRPTLRASYRGWTVPSLHGELLQSEGTEGCDVLHRDCPSPKSEGRTNFPFQAELSPGPCKDTW